MEIRKRNVHLLKKRNIGYLKDDPKLLQSLDPKTMDALMDPKMMASMYGLDPKGWQTWILSHYPSTLPDPQSLLFYSTLLLSQYSTPLPNLLPQPLLWLCPPHSGPVAAPMESAASGKICKLRRMHQLLAYHGQVSQTSNQRVQQKSDRW